MLPTKTVYEQVSGLNPGTRLPRVETDAKSRATCYLRLRRGWWRQKGSH